jgi:predicted DNA-binding transcriptional regulator AlpA
LRERFRFAVPRTAAFTGGRRGTAMTKLNSTRATAKILGRSPNTLLRWRRDGTGPVFVRAGRQIGYTDEDIAAWLAKNRRASLRDCAPPVEPLHAP